ncbi:MAG: hypothetical protein Q4G40_07950 [Brachybacterium sp.]|nr:hypothetical protein [Brachybacterium sp.]
MTSAPTPHPAPAQEARRTAGDRGMIRATALAVVIALTIDIVVILLALLFAGGPALAGALVGTALALVMTVPTYGIALIARHLGPAGMAGAVLGSWGGKMVVVLVVLLLIRDLAAVSNWWAAGALLVGAACGIIVEMVMLARTRQPLDTAPATGQDRD